MIKKTLHFSQAYYLHARNNQLVAKPAEENAPERTVPIEDIGVVVLEHPQITISHGLLARLSQNNTALIISDERHHPTGMMLNLEGHTQQTLRIKYQTEASLPLKKQLWQQTVKAKITNQAALLRQANRNDLPLQRMIEQVLSDDTTNQEGQAAAYYWKTLFGSEFCRDRAGDPPNGLLNYGYAILRATVARGLVASGLMPSLGSHHRNQYNAFCLADDIMEPFRPYVDGIVLQLWEEEPDAASFILTTGMKRVLLQIPAMDIRIDGSGSPLMVGLQRTTASLVSCLMGETKKIIYPIL